MINTFSLAVIIVRALGLWVIATSLSAIPSLLSAFELINSSMEGDANRGTLIVGAIWAASFIGLAVFFLVYAKGLARFLTRGLEEIDPNPEQHDYMGLRTVAFSLIGAYELLYSIPVLLRILAGYWLVPFPVSDGFGGFGGVRSIFPTEAVIEHSVRVALGLYLVFFSKSLVPLIRGIYSRTLSVEHPE